MTDTGKNNHISSLLRLRLTGPCKEGQSGGGACDYVIQWECFFIYARLEGDCTVRVRVAYSK